MEKKKFVKPVNAWLYFPLLLLIVNFTQNTIYHDSFSFIAPALHGRNVNQFKKLLLRHPAARCMIILMARSQLLGVESSWTWRKKLLRRWGQRGNEAAFQQWFMKCLSFSLYWWRVRSCSRQLADSSGAGLMSACILKASLVPICASWCNAARWVL